MFLLALLLVMVDDGGCSGGVSGGVVGVVVGVGVCLLYTSPSPRD